MKDRYCDNGLQEMVAQAIDQMKADYGEKFDIEHVNLAELGRRTKLPRHVLWRLKQNGFVVKPHGNTGRKAEVTVMTGYTGEKRNTFEGIVRVMRLNYGIAI